MLAGAAVRVQAVGLAHIRLGQFRGQIVGSQRFDASTLRPNPLKPASDCAAVPAPLMSCYGSGYGKLRVMLRVECIKSPVFTEVLTGLRVK